VRRERIWEKDQARKIAEWSHFLNRELYCATKPCFPSKRKIHLNRYWIYYGASRKPEAGWK
jgi:hypothetical protein